MPVDIRKLPNKDRYRVYKGGQVVARSTTHRKAMRQRRLLRGIKHGWKPTRISANTPKLR